MKFRQLHALIAIMAGCLLGSCHSDIDLTNIDLKAEVDMGLALPIGNIHATIHDFLGNGEVEHLYVEKGILTWKDTYRIARPYSRFQLKDYVPDIHMPLLNIYDVLPAPASGGTDKYLMCDGSAHVLPFPLTLKLAGINHPDSVGKQRIDKALIDSANFISTILPVNGLPLEWNWVDSIILDLGDRITREEGRKMVVYRKSEDRTKYTDFGQAMDTRIYDFMINLMKNQSATEIWQFGSVDSMLFNVDFCFTLPNDNNVLTIPKDAGIKYDMTVEFLDYKALWGMFEPSKDMRDEDTIPISDGWKDMEFLTRASLPFAEPEIKVYVNTQIAGAMRINDAYIFSVDKNGNRHPAAFGDNYVETKTEDLKNWLPLSSEIGESTTDMHIDFDKTPTGGRIDRLFKGVPKLLGYKFNVNFNQQTTPQIRVTPNTDVEVEARVTLPFVFHDSLHIDYTDTLRDVNLSQYSIDSLTAQNEIIDSMAATNVTLFLTAYNTIPLDIKAHLRCINAAGDTIMDPEDPSKPLTLFEEDELTFLAPQFEYIGANWQRVSEGRTVVTTKMTKQKLNKLPEIKNIVYTAELDVRSLSDEFKDSNKDFTAKITDDAGLTIKIGLTAQADVILNLNKK